MSTAKTFNEISHSTNLKNGTICLVQLARIGDLIQTYQAAKIFKAAHPEIRLILVARKKFASGLDFILSNLFTKIYYFDYTEHRKDTLSETQSSLLGFFSLIGSEQVDVTINMTFSKSSSHFVSMIDSKHYLGPHTSRLGANLVKDRWSQLVYSSVMRGPLNPFNLVDIFKNMLGTSKCLSLVPSQVEKEKTIVIHPFASQVKKQWRPNKWIEVLFRVLKDHPDHSVIIAGTQAEAAFALEILSAPILQSYRDRIISKCGQTSLNELFQIIKSATLFVGHDSMGCHLAALAQTQTLTVSLGTVRPFETAPYGENNYILAPRTSCFPCFPNDKCTTHACHADIPHQLVSSAINTLILHGHIRSEDVQKENSIFHLSGANIYRTYFTTQGNLDLASISGNAMDEASLFRLFYRITYLYQFIQKEEFHEMPELSPATRSALSHYLGGIDHLYQLAEFGMKYCRYIIEEIASKSPSLEKIKDYSNKVDEIDKLQEMVLTPYPLLKPVVDFFTLAKANTPGNHLVEIAENSFLLYNDYAIFSKILYDLIAGQTSTTELAKTTQTRNNIRENL